MNDDGFRVEVVRRRRRVARARWRSLRAPGMTVPFVLHSAWMPTAAGRRPTTSGTRFADELDRVGELPDDLADVAREVAADLDTAAPLAS